ncbi:M16 family metallopeptidase [Tepidibacter formicigenes]|uniref:Predicted Zn-dependent peptidase n=1 Tax=Tepidibacter formicigenes DSM 15518 TaxID=1123349 RepID=A0A1M6JD46_9FIRM|nr:pitrilysin family protein [Tepidibacter formicigenes]SHJ44641.1 Predicted Zn-dependent peptidase [Tepidibacter formicigenes DSM 15518]
MYKKHILDNGLVIVGEEIPYVNSVSFGLWINVGTRYEDKNINGMSHFIEHMLFKGTKNRSAKKIAQDIDNLGGQINAFTSKESTCFYVKMLDEHIYTGIDVICDMILNPLFLEEDIIKEKSVVLEEIKMYDDSPEDLAHDLLFELIYKNEGLGMNILGTRNSLDNINRESVIEFFDNYYVPKNCVISICGNFKFEDIVSLLNEKLKGWNNNNFNSIDINKCEFNSGVVKKNKDIEQINLCMGLKSIELESNEVYALSVVNNIFGGSMSSRLFQNIREEKGSVYSIYSYPTLHKKSGVLNIFASTSEKNLNNVYSSILDEIKLLKDNYLTADEIEKSKEQLKGNYILGLEGIGSRMMAIGKSQLLLKKLNTPKDIINNINSITINDVKNVIDKTFNINTSAVCIVGKDVENIKI